MSLGVVLKKARLDRNLTIEDVFNITHIKIPIISSIENGRGALYSLEELEKISILYNIPLDELVWMNEDAKKDVEIMKTFPQKVPTQAQIEEFCKRGMHSWGFVD